MTFKNGIWGAGFGWLEGVGMAHIVCFQILLLCGEIFSMYYRLTYGHLLVKTNMITIQVIEQTCKIKMKENKKLTKYVVLNSGVEVWT